jgi:hypothetical protein
VANNPWDNDPIEKPQSITPWDNDPIDGAPEKSSVLRRAGDYGISALKGAIAVPEAAVGLADIVTGGRAGKAAEEVGFRPREAKEILDTYLSPEQQTANKAVADAKGFLPTISAAVKNPSTIAQTVVESVPSMLGGGVIARGVSKLLPAVTPVIAGAIGEGAVGAGSAAENVRQQTDDGLLGVKEIAPVVASGVGTAAFGAAGGRIAQKLGITDVDTLLAQGGAGATQKGIARRIVEGGISEGVFEELPQSVQEQIWQNVALDKPLLEGVPESGAFGLLAGGVMGGVASGAFTNKQGQTQPAVQPAAQTQPEQPALGLPNYPNEPLISFPDGSAGTQSQAEEYINGLPEDQRIQARSALYGYAPEAAAKIQEEVNKNPTLLLPNARNETLVGFPDGSIGTRAQAEEYINGLPESERMAKRAALLGYTPQSAAPAGPLARAAQKVMPTASIIPAGADNATIENAAAGLATGAGGPGADFGTGGDGNSLLLPGDVGVQGLGANAETLAPSGERDLPAGTAAEQPADSVAPVDTAGPVKDPSAQQDQSTDLNVEPQALQQIIEVKDKYGRTHRVLQSDLDGTSDRLPTIRKNGDVVSGEEIPRSILALSTNASTPPGNRAEPAPAPAQAITPESGSPTSPELRPIVESIAKRRAVAEGQLGKNKAYGRVLAAAKDMMNGQPVKLGRLRIDVNELKGDKELHAAGKRLIEIASAPAKQATESRAQTAESYRKRIDEAKTKDELNALASEIQKDESLTDQQAQDLDDAVFERVDQFPEPTKKPAVSQTKTENAPEAKQDEPQTRWPVPKRGGFSSDAQHQGAVAAVEFQNGDINKSELIERLGGLGLQEAVVEAVTYRLQDDWTAADTRAVMAKGTKVPEQPAKKEAAIPSSPAVKSPLQEKIDVAKADGKTEVELKWGDFEIRKSKVDGRDSFAVVNTSTGDVVGNFGSADTASIIAAQRAEKAASESKAKPEKTAAVTPEPASKIEDLGEKIGGARKDTSTKGGTKAAKAKAGDDRPAWAKRYEINQVAAAMDESIVGKWAIYDSRDKNRLGMPRQMGGSNNFYDTREAAEAELPELAVSQKHKVYATAQRPDGTYGYEIYRNVTDRKRVKIVDRVFGSRVEALEYMGKNAADILETNTTFGEIDLPTPDNVNRIGVERRTGDVADTDFIGTFGFRGVEFGNWNNQIERQQFMNAAYDGLLDLADVLNIPPKAISLNGDLALAFGARGQGLTSAKAHYEREKSVINLTKENGAGSLAHEFFHAMDHYFGRQDGKASAEWKMDADGTRSFTAGKTPDSDYVSAGFSYKSNVRPELKEAYKKLMETIFRKAATYVEDTQQADKFVAAAKDRLAESLDKLRAELSQQKDPKYWKRKNAPASAEQLAEFDTIAEQLLNGQWLDAEYRGVEGKSRSRFGNMRRTNDALEKLSALHKDVRGRSGFDSTNQSGVMDGLRQTMSNYSMRLKTLSDAQAGQEKVKTVPTDFLMNARELDEGRGKDYWTTPHEMAARAFQGYVEDKIAENGGRSPFMNYGREGAGILTPWGVKFPFPRGDERKAINSALDKFVSEIQIKETEQGVALFSRGTDTGQSMKERIDAVIAANDETRGVPFVVSENSPASLRMFGWEDLPVVMRTGRDGVMKLHYDHGLSSSAIADVMTNGLNKPVMTLQHKGQHDVESIWIVTDKLHNSEPIVIAVQPESVSATGKVHLVATAISKPWSVIASKIRNGDLLYRDTTARVHDAAKIAVQVAQKKYAQAPRSLLGLIPKSAPVRGRAYKVLSQSDLVKLEPSPDVTLSRGTGAGIQLSKAQSLAADLAKKFPNLPAAIVVQSQSEIPEVKRDIERAMDEFKSTGTEASYSKLKRVSKNDIEGAYIDGKFYLVAGNISSEARLREVFAHEGIGHLSVESMLNEVDPRMMPKLVNQVRMLDAGGNKYIRQLAKEVDKRQPGLDKETRAKEIIAFIAERGDQDVEMTSAVRSLWQRIVDGIKAFAKLVFDVNLTDRDVRDIVAMAARYAKGEDVVSLYAAGESVMFSRDGKDQTDSAAFKKWFGASKVVDAEGNPLVVYHGTGAKFDTFVKSDGGTFGDGIYLTASKEAAQEYADTIGGDSTVMELYVSIKNPAPEDIASEVESRFGPSTSSELRRMGYDGIMAGDEIIAFSPEQIKSAIGNNGDFDASNPNITLSRKPPSLTTVSNSTPRPGWASQTKIRGKDGKPAVVYRGASTSLREKHFDKENFGKNSGHISSGLGVWFSSSPKEAEAYGRAEKFALDMRNPKTIKVEDLPSFESVEAALKFGKNLEDQGFDGIAVSATHLGGNVHYIAFSPEQVIASESRVMFSRAPQSEEASKYADLNRKFREEHITLLDKSKKWLKRQLAPGGLLPKSVFEEKIRRDSEFEVIEFDVKHLVGQLERAIQKDFKLSPGELDTKTQELLSDVMAGKIGDVPESTKVALLGMRQYIDQLSMQYIDGLAEQGRMLMQEAERTGDAKLIAEAQERFDLMQVIMGNVGQYVHRSYRAFDDPDWARNVPDATLDAARDYLIQRNLETMTPATAAARAEIVLNEILKNGTAYDNMEAFIRESKLGAKDLSVLKTRKQIAPQIRALLGEYTDPRINFAKSATKMGRLIWNQKFLEKVLDVGMGNFLFTDDTKPPEATAKIAADKSEVYSPLNGLWTFPETDQAFKDALGKEQMADWFRKVVQINGMVKYGKTVLSPTTAARNWMSAFFFSVANGHFDLRHMKKSVDGLKEYFTHGGDAAKLAYLRELKQLGVVYDTPYAGEMMRLLADTNLSDKLLMSKGKLKIKNALDLATKGYQYGDDFWKIIGYENEKRMWMDTGMPEQQAKEKAAERIRNTYPTYSMVGKGIQSLRRFPLAGTFVSFPAEIIRTSINMVRYLAEDYKDPVTRPLAMRRAAGMAIASSFAYAAQALSMAALGYDDDDEEAVRQMAAPWQRNSNLLFTGRDGNGNIRFLDMSFLDPYNYWKRPIVAVTRGQPFDEALRDVASEILTPFFGVDILAGTIFEVLANKKESGAPVYQGHDDAINQLTDIANHMRKTIQPGIVSNMERTYKALDGEVSFSGKKYDINDEAAAWVGFRVSTLDPKVALYYRSFDFKDAKAEADKSLRDVIRKPKGVDSEDLREAYDMANKLRERAYQQMSQLVQAGQRSGMTNQQVFQTLKNSGISNQDIFYIRTGMTPRYKVNPQSMREQIMKARGTFGPEVAQEIRKRYAEVAGYQ